jgi:hypothetical protein
MNYSSLSAFVGWCIDCKNIHSTSNTKIFDRICYNYKPTLSVCCHTKPRPTALSGPVIRNARYTLIVKLVVQFVQWPSYFSDPVLCLCAVCRYVQHYPCTLRVTPSPHPHRHALLKLSTHLLTIYIYTIYIYIYIYISNQLDVTFSKFFHLMFAPLHVSDVPCPYSGVNLLHW